MEDSAKMLLIFAGVLLIAGLVSNKSEKSSGIRDDMSDVELDDDSTAKVLKESKAGDDRSPGAILNATKIALEMYVNNEDGAVQEHLTEANNLFGEVRHQFVNLKVSPLPSGLADRIQDLLKRNFAVQQGWTKLARRCRNITNQPIERFRENASNFWAALQEVKWVFSNMAGVNANDFNNMMKDKRIQNFQTNLNFYVDQHQDHFYKQTLNLQKNYDQRVLNMQQNIDERQLHMTKKDVYKMYDQSQHALGLTYAPTAFIQQGYPEGGPAEDPYDPNWRPDGPDMPGIDFNSSPDNQPPPPPPAPGVGILQDNSTLPQFNTPPLMDQRRETNIAMQEIVTPSDAIKPFKPKPPPDAMNPLAGGFGQVPVPSIMAPVPVVQPRTHQHMIDEQIRLDMRDTEKPKRTRGGELKSDFDTAPSAEKSMEEMIPENKIKRSKVDKAFNQTKRKTESSFVQPSRSAEGIFPDKVDSLYQQFSNRMGNKQWNEAQALYGRMWRLAPTGGKDGNVIIVRGNTEIPKTYGHQEWLDYLEWRIKAKMDVWSRITDETKNEWRELSKSADVDKQYQKLKRMQKDINRRSGEMGVTTVY